MDLWFRLKHPNKKHTYIYNTHMHMGTVYHIHTYIHTYIHMTYIQVGTVYHIHTYDIHAGRYSISHAYI